MQANQGEFSPKYSSDGEAEAIDEQLDSIAEQLDGEVQIVGQKLTVTETMPHREVGGALFVEK